MSVEIERPRVLLAARPPEAVQLRNLFAEPPLEQWDVLEADTFERARFLLLHNPCEILLVDESLYLAAGSAGLAWLTRHREMPAIFLTGMDPYTVAQAYEQGIGMCLPRHLALEHPQVLAAALNRAAAAGETHQNLRRCTERLHKSHRQIDRLVNLLWRNAPMDPEHQWFTHRHVLERLQEEVARCGRHGTVFTLAIGEVDQVPVQKSETDDLSDWTTDAVSRAKRRCDVAGNYGLHGFMLLMVQTPGPGGVVCCRRLQTRLQESAQTAGGPHGPIRASFGLASFAPDTATTEILLSRAEKHLQAAKAGAAGGVVAE